MDIQTDPSRQKFPSVVWVNAECHEDKPYIQSLPISGR